MKTLLEIQVTRANKLFDPIFKTNVTGIAPMARNKNKPGDKQRSR